MKRSPRPRKTAELPRSLHQQLNLYAIVAGAAGVGMLALAQPADAKIVYTPAHKVISPNTNFYLDLLNNGSHEFLLSNISKSSGNGGDALEHAYMRIRGLGTYAGAAGDSQGFARAMRANRRVGPAIHFQSTAGMMTSTCQSGNARHSGPWQNVKHRYLGLQFWVNRHLHYGWARLDVSDSACKITVTLTGYAYETIPNKSIITGKTKGPDELEGWDVSLTAPTPQSATLGMLALGAPALSIWRRDLLETRSKRRSI